MHVLIRDTKGRHHAVKRCDIRRVSENVAGVTSISFRNRKENPAIQVPYSVEVFYNTFLVKQQDGTQAPKK